MKRYRIIMTISLFVIFGAAVDFFLWRDQSPRAIPLSSAPLSNETNAQQNISSTKKSSDELLWPMAKAEARITKKPFGIYITPKNSPIQPEKFSGYHTGTDFETLPDEQNNPVNISALCAGPLIYKGWVSGYGGVAMQRCVIEKITYTVLYGHLRLESITAEINSTLKAGDHLAVLGKGYGQETDGERKHLHLGIHVGATINFRGYVTTTLQLSSWIDAAALLRKSAM